MGDVKIETLHTLIEQLEDIFQKAELLETVPLIESAYNSKRGQYLSDELLHEVKWHVALNGENHTLGVTTVDLYTQGLNFVFGQAELPGKAAIISLNRLNHQSTELFHNRMLKEAVHELGHTMGLRHCSNIKCVMHFSNSLEDTDIKDAIYCPRCDSILKKKINI